MGMAARDKIIIDGKSYRFHDAYRSKVQAQREALRLRTPPRGRTRREWGVSSRAVKVLGGYAVYSHD